MKKIFKSQQGISLIEVIIAAAISIAIGLGVARISQDASKGMTKIKTDSELGDFKNFMKTNFTRGKNCTRSFAGLVMDGPIAGLHSDTTIVPANISPVPSYYKISTDADANASSFDMVVNADEFDPSNDKIKSLTAGQRVEGYPNWTINEIRVYQIGNSTTEGDKVTGLCPLYFEVKRDAGLNSQRSFGAGDVNFWVTLSCTLDNATKEMVYCIENQAVVPGFWTLQNTTDPTFGIRYDGDVYVGANIIVESDERIKKDITKIDHASEKLSEISGKYYFLRHEEFPHKNYSHDRQIGVIAQEVEKIFPEAVQTNSNGVKAVRYSMLVPVLIEAHKEQKERIDKLEKMVEKLLTK